MATHFSILAWRIPWTEEPGQKESDMNDTTYHARRIIALQMIRKKRFFKKSTYIYFDVHNLKFDVFGFNVYIYAVPWTAKRSNGSTLKEISPEYSLEGLMLKLKLQYFGHLMRRTNSLEKTLMLQRLRAKGEGADK